MLLLLLGMTLKIDRQLLILNPKGGYRQLHDVFPSIVAVLAPYLRIRAAATGNTILNQDEGEEFDDRISAIIRKNQEAMFANQKPEGINWDSVNLRLIFPIRKQPAFYLYGFKARQLIIDISNLLIDSNIEHHAEADTIILVTRGRPTHTWFKQKRMNG